MTGAWVPGDLIGPLLAAARLHAIYCRRAGNRDVALRLEAAAEVFAAALANDREPDPAGVRLRQWATVTEASRRLHLSPQRVRHLAHVGVLPGHKIAGTWHMDAVTIDRHRRDTA